MKSTIRNIIEILTSGIPSILKQTKQIYPVKCDLPCGVWTLLHGELISPGPDKPERSSHTNGVFNVIERSERVR
jgi:hypothetical protein